jgi:hypothetical protein
MIGFLLVVALCALIVAVTWLSMTAEQLEGRRHDRGRRARSRSR